MKIKSFIREVVDNIVSAAEESEKQLNREIRIGTIELDITVTCNPDNESSEPTRIKFPIHISSVRANQEN